MNDAPKLEKGGLALIINANMAFDNIGRVVTLGDYVAPGEKLSYRGGVMTGSKYGTWMVMAEGLKMYGTLPCGSTEEIISNVSFAQSNHLMPLKGKDGDLTKQKDRTLEGVT